MISEISFTVNGSTKIKELASGFVSILHHLLTNITKNATKQAQPRSAEPIFHPGEQPEPKKDLRDNQLADLDDFHYRINLHSEYTTRKSISRCYKYKPITPKNQVSL
jgi:hypothetical protein